MQSNFNVHAHRLVRAGLVLVILGGRSQAETSATGGPDARPIQVAADHLTVTLDSVSGLPTQIVTRSETDPSATPVQWLHGPVRLSLRQQVSGVSRPAGPVRRHPQVSADHPAWQRAWEELYITSWEGWEKRSDHLAWEANFVGEAPRVEHEISIELPILDSTRQVFTPGERGAMSLEVYPTFEPVPYAHFGWNTDRWYVLPLVSVWHPQADQALTIALPADDNIPHLQVDWTNATTLRLRLGRRGMGDGQNSTLRLLFFTHAADERGVLARYTRLFPAYFEPVLPPAPHHGAFWYHHIQEHPPLDEMARQNIRWMWSSFWFTHLGEYLPDDTTWKPYTYARWWKLGRTLSDTEIRDFIRSMSDAGIGVFAYFNITEYGGAGGETGDADEAARRLRDRFAYALVHNEQGQPIPTWEGAMAMNCRPQYALFPFLRDQLQRHLDRLPEIAGFAIDRLDWSSTFDYAHHDGLSMVGSRPVENLAQAIAIGLDEICTTAHAAGKYVYVNQHWRVEVQRNVDGICHEYDFPSGLGYLSPFRPVAAWHYARPYHSDLLAFEAQLKQRLHWAVHPQMIAAEFPISQQAADPEAAAMLEAFAPLFDKLRGKRQVLIPHAIETTGPHRVNLFTNPQGDYVIPIGSRTAFLCRGGYPAYPLQITLRTPDASLVRWAHLYPVDGPPAPVGIRHEADRTVFDVEHHATSSVLVAGAGAEPELARPAWAVPPVQTKPTDAREPESAAATDYNGPCELQVWGRHVGAKGWAGLYVDQRKLGDLHDGANTFHLDPDTLPATPCTLQVRTGDTGTWFVPQAARLIAGVAEPAGRRIIARWNCNQPVLPESTPTCIQWVLSTCEPIPVAPTQARFIRQQPTAPNPPQPAGKDCLVWLPHQASPASTPRYHLDLHQGSPFTWISATLDPRVWSPPGLPAGPRTSSCWFDPERVAGTVVPWHDEPYELSLYVLDYDRQGRAATVILKSTDRVLDQRLLTSTELAEGVLLTWKVWGAIDFAVQRDAGVNTVLSGVMIAPAAQR